MFKYKAIQCHYIQALLPINRLVKFFMFKIIELFTPVQGQGQTIAVPGNIQDSGANDLSNNTITL